MQRHFNLMAFRFFTQALTRLKRVVSGILGLSEIGNPHNLYHKSSAESETSFLCRHTLRTFL